ncbi:helix-turn-helix domain-containing protein [Nostoc sp. ChiQUE01b]|uniref:helix-turn-helix domain-containing protein n=1 Tax=Nostoc sp. ChiQUE01b TaxID=3075376 RepID=UPI002AD466D8|nr:helix-turn-helix domain-containing protein [Nostoc sp. ChiQUE01b]MDZ8260580.1 helix-turn-helix domain-containing protein [Nostoc sp. ChiQUE01b]
MVEVLPDGSEQPISSQPMRSMTEEEIIAAAFTDPDAIPLTEEQLKTARRVPRVKTMRRALQLTQEEFAARYHIPLGTLRDWEQGRSKPDETAQAYLKAIAGNPEAVYQALRFTPQ